MGDVLVLADRAKPKREDPFERPLDSMLLTLRLAFPGIDAHVPAAHPVGTIEAMCPGCFEGRRALRIREWFPGEPDGPFDVVCLAGCSAERIEASFARLRRFVEERLLKKHDVQKTKPSRPRQIGAMGKGRIDAQRLEDLRTIPASEWATALTGHEAVVGRHIPCPFHDERTPSCVVRGDHLFCYGSCGRAFDIFALASHVWRIEPRGAGFIEIVELLEAAFLGKVAA